MQHYLINASIIWLVGLALYESLFKKESFHQYNRFFLLGSLAAGCILPSLTFNFFTSKQSPTFNKPIAQIVEMKKMIHAPAIDTSASTNIVSNFDFASIILGLYIIGFLICFGYVMKEAILLVRYFIQGNKYKEGRRIIVQTTKDHAPFSFFHIIFVRSRLDFNSTEWNLIIAHENEHGAQFHSIDNLLLLMLRMICWFHPLPHIYYKKLRTIHEFQADEAASLQAPEYGKFILEQTFLQGAPLLTHSINYSPISKRITMLTQTKSNRRQLIKYLSVLPIISMLFVFCSHTEISDASKVAENKIKFNGNEIEFGVFKIIPWLYTETYKQQSKMFMNFKLPDIVPVKDPTTGMTNMVKVMRDTIPVALNGKPIFGNESQYEKNGFDADYKEPALEGGQKDIEHLLFEKLQLELNTLPDGRYLFNTNRMVINDAGRFVYYENPGINGIPDESGKHPQIPIDVQKNITSIMIETFDHTAHFSPAIKAGKPINVRYMFKNYAIEIKNHKASLVEGGGC